MILSASRRTDIPSYYSEWFMNRLKAGFADFRNPVNHRQLYRIPLSPDTVDCIVFWTKNPEPMLGRLPELDRMGYPYYFQFTITPYGSDMERSLPEKERILKTFERLSKMIGPRRVLWRYDPILLNENISLEFHKESFTKFCERLSPYTNRVTISFLDLYRKIKSDQVLRPNHEQIAELADFIGRTAADYSLEVFACCEAENLAPYGINPSACIDKTLIEEICGVSMDLKPDHNQRKCCGCCESIDIGAYNTCGNGCVYCYATYSDPLIDFNNRLYDPSASLLCGAQITGEEVILRDVCSNRSGQLSFY